ncbi:MAG TPA: hypothetical protein VLJ86_12660 [Ramlibacter sp.]|nr:hypothetical protein [Ramlibacter sp.]
MNPTPKLGPVDLSAESVAGEEDPGAAIDLAVSGVGAGAVLSPGEEFCRSCGGSGKLNDAVCPDCEGRGKIRVATGGAAQGLRR